MWIHLVLQIMLLVPLFLLVLMGLCNLSIGDFGDFNSSNANFVGGNTNRFSSISPIGLAGNFVNVNLSTWQPSLHLTHNVSFLSPPTTTYCFPSNTFLGPGRGNRQIGVFGRGNGNGFGRNGFARGKGAKNNSWPTCQMCCRIGHVVAFCYY